MADVRSSGTVIGAVLESVGYHYQAHILDVLGNPLVNEVGGLVYLVAVVILIGTMVADGGFKGGVWMLVGPPLFLACLTVRDPIDNAVWQFGEETRNQEPVERGLAEKNIVGQANVSAVFARYVGFISDITREIIAKMTNGRTQDDIDLLMKAELFARMHTGREFSPGLHELIHTALLGTCGKLVQAAQEVNDTLQRNVDPNSPRAPQVGDGSTQQANDYLTPTRREAETRFREQWDKPIMNLSGPAAQYITGIRQQRAAAGKEVEYTKFEAFKCSNVWEYVLLGLLDRAEQMRKSTERFALANGLDAARLQNLFLRAHGVNTGKPTSGGAQGADGQSPPMSATEVEQINKLIAQYLLRNEVSAGSFVDWLSHFEEKDNFREVATTTMGANAYTEQSRLGASEWAEQGRVMQLASSMPYYQGLALFVLAVIFPFFALLLLIPGKHGGFILWFLLWMWVKSWDIGFAVVMLLDQFLFGMLSVVKSSQPTQGVSADIGVTMAALRTMDPTFQLATHHTIIGVSLLAVPTVMATLVMGGMKGGAGLIAQGADRQADFFAKEVMQKTQNTAVNNLQMDQKELGRSMANQAVAETKAGREKLTHTSQHGSWEALAAVASGSDDGNAAGPAPAGDGGGQRLQRPGTGRSLPPQIEPSPIGAERSALAGYNYESSVQRMQERAGTSAFFGGMMNPTRITTDKNSFAFLNVAASLGAPAAKIQNVVARQEAGLTQDWLNAAATQGNWNAILSDEGKSIAAKMWLFGGIPITQTGFSTEPSGTDFNLEMRAREMQSTLKVARLEAAGIMAEKAEDMSQSLFKKSLSQLFGGGDDVSPEVLAERQQLVSSMSTLFKGTLATAGVATNPDEVATMANSYTDTILSAERYEAVDPIPFFLNKDTPFTDFSPQTSQQRMTGDFGATPYAEDNGFLHNQIDHNYRIRSNQR